VASRLRDNLSTRPATSSVFRCLLPAGPVC